MGTRQQIKRKAKMQILNKLLARRVAKVTVQQAWVACIQKPDTNTAPKESESVSRMEKNTELLADNMVKLTSEVMKLKSNQEQAQTVQWNEQYETILRGTISQISRVQVFIKIKTPCWANHTRMNPSILGIFYDADRPLIDCFP